MAVASARGWPEGQGPEEERLQRPCPPRGEGRLGQAVEDGVPWSQTRYVEPVIAGHCGKFLLSGSEACVAQLFLRKYKFCFIRRILVDFRQIRFKAVRH